MVIALIILFVVTFIVIKVVSTKPSNTESVIKNDIQQIEFSDKKNPRKISLEGVAFSEGTRIEAFKEVQEGDQVTIKFDYGNQYDNNALGVYTKTGKLLGYIPKGKPSIIKAVRSESKKLAIVTSKIDGYSQWDKEIKIVLV